MLAIGIVRGKKGVHQIDLPQPSIEEPDEVLVRVKEVGLDGTDFNMLHYNLQDISEGRNEMVIGHEMTGVVEEVGKNVRMLTPGDTVAVTVRRGCGICSPCLHNKSDMCMTGLYTERGLHKQDGFLTQFIVDKEQYIVKVPSELSRLAIFTEPLSIAEKAIDQIRIIQSRLPWTCLHPEHTFLSEEWGGCLNALVVGAGPLGILTTALLRISNLNTYTSDILNEKHPRVMLIKAAGSHYIDSRNKSPKEVVRLCCTLGNLDIIIEAAGAAAQAVGLINYMSRSSIYVMTGIPRGDMRIKVDAAELVRHLVLYNQVVVGSVNSNSHHFEMALRDLPRINSNFDSLLDKMITNRYHLEEYQEAFASSNPKAVKTVIEVEPWD
jgi:threonine dehydrogenase-like Zn-dependent dehydrogenase